MTSAHSPYGCRALDCQAGYNECKKRGGSSETCAPILTSGDLERTLGDACRMATLIHFQGAALWRWLLVALLFWPLELVAYGVARLSAAVSMMLINTTLVKGSVCFCTFRAEYSSSDSHIHCIL